MDAEQMNAFIEDYKEFEEQKYKDEKKKRQNKDEAIEMAGFSSIYKEFFSDSNDGNILLPKSNSNANLRGLNEKIADLSWFRFTGYSNQFSLGKLLFDTNDTISTFYFFLKQILF